MRVGEMLVIAVSAVLAALLIIVALHGGSLHRSVNFVAPPLWD